MKKLIVVHVDQYLEDEIYKKMYIEKLDIQKKMTKMRQTVLELLSKYKKNEICKINEYTDLSKLSSNEKVYILNNGTTVGLIAKKIINPEDEITLVGLYRNACLETIKQVADKKGTTTIIPENGSMNSEDFFFN